MEEQMDDLDNRNNRLQNDLQDAHQSFERHKAAAEKECQSKLDQMESSREEEMERVRSKYEKILHLFEEKLRRLQSLQSHQNEKMIKNQVDSLNEQTRRQIEIEFGRKLEQ